jgi:hypothetical protein
VLVSPRYHAKLLSSAVLNQPSQTRATHLVHIRSSMHNGPQHMWLVSEGRAMVSKLLESRRKSGPAVT